VVTRMNGTRLLVVVPVVLLLLLLLLLLLQLLFRVVDWQRMRDQSRGFAQFGMNLDTGAGRSLQIKRLVTRGRRKEAVG